MMDWFRGVSKTEAGDASDGLLKQGDKEREAGDLTAALHYYCLLYTSPSPRDA